MIDHELGRSVPSPGLLKVLAFMAYPASPEPQQWLFAALTLDLIAQGAFSDYPDEFELYMHRLLSSSGASALEIKAKAMRQHDRGIIAGLVLEQILRLAQHAPQHASAQKAIWLTAADLKKRKKKVERWKSSGKKARRNSNYRLVAANRYAIDEAWDDKREVAHLYAALVWAKRRQEKGAGYYLGSGFENLIMPPEVVREFMETAEAFRKMGRAHRPARSHYGSVLAHLDELEPDSELFQVGAFDFDPVTRSELELLDRYIPLSK